MTQYFYLAAPKKLPNGSFGSNPVSAQKPHVFRTSRSHIYFLKIIWMNSPKRDFPLALILR